MRQLTSKTFVQVRVRADGPTKVLELLERGLEEAEEGEEGGAATEEKGVEGEEGEKEEDEDDEGNGDDDDDEVEGGLRLRVRAPRLGVSLVDDGPLELVYLSLSDITIGVCVSRSRHLTVGATVESLQVDDQGGDAPFPVVLRQRAAGHGQQLVLPGLEARAADKAPAVHFFISQRNRARTPGLLYYDACSVFIAPLDVWVADTLLLRAWALRDRVAVRSLGRRRVLTLVDAPGAAAEDGWRSRGLAARLGAGAAAEALRGACVSGAAHLRRGGLASMARKGLGKKVYFTFLHVAPLDVNLNYRDTGALYGAAPEEDHAEEAGAAGAEALRGGSLLLSGSDLAGLSGDARLEALAAASAGGAASAGAGGRGRGRGGSGGGGRRDARRASGGYGPWILQLASQLDDAALRLGSLEVQHAFGTRSHVTEVVVKHYYFAALSQLHNVVRSVDFLGNPVGLLSNLGTGVRDFIYEPVRATAAEKTASAFIGGLKTGSTSLASNTIGGTADFLHKFSSNMGKGLAHLSLDKDFRRNRNRAHALRAQTVQEGLVEGARELGRGVLEGVSGIVLAPYRGAEAEGLKGFGKGVVRGVLGVAVKPTVGVLDFASRATEGIRSAARAPQREAVQRDPTLATGRVRQPRVFGPRGELLPFDGAVAWARFLLHHVAGGRYASEKLRWYLKVPCKRTSEQAAAVEAALLASTSAAAQGAPDLLVLQALIARGGQGERGGGGGGGSAGGGGGAVVCDRYVLCSGARLLLVEETARHRAAKALLVLEAPWRDVSGVAPAAEGVRLQVLRHILCPGEGAARRLAEHSTARSALIGAHGGVLRPARAPSVPVAYDEGAQCELSFARMLSEALGPGLAVSQPLHPAPEDVFCEGAMTRSARGGGIMKTAKRFVYRLSRHVLYEYRELEAGGAGAPLYHLNMAVPLVGLTVQLERRAEMLSGRKRHFVRLLPAGGRREIQVIRVQPSKATAGAIGAELHAMARKAKGEDSGGGGGGGSGGGGDSPLLFGVKDEISLAPVDQKGGEGQKAAEHWAIALENMVLSDAEVAKSKREGDGMAHRVGHGTAEGSKFGPRTLFLDFSGAVEPDIAEAAATGIITLLARMASHM